MKGPKVVPAPNMVSMTAMAVAGLLLSHLMASGYTALLMADSPIAVRDLIRRERPRKTGPDSILGRNPNMMLVRPAMTQPTVNNLRRKVISVWNISTLRSHLVDRILSKYFPNIGVETICRTKAEANTIPLLVTDIPWSSASLL